MAMVKGGLLPGAVTAALLSALGCRDATQITVVVKNDFQCMVDDARYFNEAGVAIGTDQNYRKKSASATTENCGSPGETADSLSARKDHYIGEIIITPSESRREALTFEVTGAYGGFSVDQCVGERGRELVQIQCGADADPECGESHSGCIWATRSLRFIPHENLVMTVPLRFVCGNKICEEHKVCVKGSCRDRASGDIEGMAGMPGAGGDDSGGTSTGASGGVAGQTGTTGGDAGAGGVGAVGATGGSAGATGGTSGTGGSTGGTGGSAGATGGTGGTGGSTGGTGGVVTGAPSCAEQDLRCGDNGESCCTMVAMVGGVFMMGRGLEGTSDAFDGQIDEEPEHRAELAPFLLDKYEVTVGRYRAFAADYSSWHEVNGFPMERDGAPPGWPDNGWKPEYGTDLRPPQSIPDNLMCFTNYSAEAGTQEDWPMNCLTWHEAFAFCIWDGGRLPTEAEWEFAAAGGSEDRLYPWADDPFAVPTPGVEGVFGGGGGGVSDRVGTHPLGAGRWLHHDLAGNVAEWVQDEYLTEFYAGVEAGCTNCFNPPTGAIGLRVLRGGSHGSANIELRAAARSGAEADFPSLNIGFRCARNP